MIGHYANNSNKRILFLAQHLNILCLLILFMQSEQLQPQELLARAKQQKYHYKVMTEAFSIDGHEFVIHNLSLKKDYSDLFDYINFRRGLSFIEEIVDFKHTQPAVARKGLRKFRDLMAEYLEIKESYVNSSNYHHSQRERLFKQLQNSNCSSYLIYNTEKINGQNAQISVVQGKYWLIGTKNKCLLAQSQPDLQKLKNKHEYKQNILTARAWFKLLQKRSQQEIQAIKLELSDKTLVGEYCNMENMQHLVNYGNEAQLFFYAMVDKNNLKQDCLPLSATFKFLDKYELPRVKSEIIEAKTVDQTFERLREVVVRMNEMTMKQGGEGSVVYVAGVDGEGERNMAVCKVKTIEYRIYRKLREKLKVYLQKHNNNYDNLLKKFTKQIGQLGRQFKLNRPLEEYVELAKRAFVLCQAQNRPISRFISNRFIDFLRLLEKNIPREKFMEIVNSDHYQGEQDEQDKSETNEKEINTERPQKQQKSAETLKKVLVLIPVSIPSSGKTSVIELIRKSFDPSFRIWSISSDEIRRTLIDELTHKMKNISRKQAFERTGDKANKIFYTQMGEVFRDISASEQTNHVFFIDKNHPESALKPGIKNLEEKSGQYKNIRIAKIALLPKCQDRLREKGLYNYPFSLPYVLSCLKRVASRPEHLTLEGSEEERCSIVFGFSNLFRNFSLSPYNLGKYFDGRLEMVLHNEDCVDRERQGEVYELVRQILLKGKPGKFEAHPRLEHFVKILGKLELAESDREASAKQVVMDLQLLFEHFETISLSEITQKQRESEKE